MDRDLTARLRVKGSCSFPLGFRSGVPVNSSTLGILPGEKITYRKEHSVIQGPNLVVD